jgi:hypothetical protein
VYFGEDSKPPHVIKLTQPGTYGEHYYLVHGKIHQEKCTVLEYLVRMHLWRKLFGASPIPEGITDTGRIVSKQDFISGIPASQEEVDAFLEASGLEPVKPQFWLWKKKYEEFEFWVGDARCDNFVKSGSAIIPIDLRLWLGPTFGHSE